MREQIPSESIATLEELTELVDQLREKKMLHPLEAKKLVHRLGSASDIKFPINFQQFEQIISSMNVR